MLTCSVCFGPISWHLAGLCTWMVSYVRYACLGMILTCVIPRLYIECTRFVFSNRKEKRSKKCLFEVQPCSWLHMSGVQPEDLARDLNYEMEALSGTFTRDEASFKKHYAFLGHGESVGCVAVHWALWCRLFLTCWV